MRSQLSIEILLAGQFHRVGSWQLDAASALILDGTAPDEPGVYAFALDGGVQYVGVASVSLARRLYFYRKPAATQRTNIRINATLREALTLGGTLDVYAATPPALSWAGWPVSVPEGLEAGIIRAYDLPWNMRGAVKSIDVQASEIAHPRERPIVAKELKSHTAISNGKYRPLCDFLRECSQEKVSMTFTGIEKLVGPLPKSASLHRAWWANHEGNAQAKGWMPARYLAEPDPPHRTVIFRRFSY